MKIIRSRGAAALLCAGAIGLGALAVVLPTSAQQTTAKQATKAGASQPSRIHNGHGHRRQRS
jgi:hypothetical protein